MKVLVVGAASWDTVVHLDRLPDARPHTVFASRSYETVGATGAGKALNLARLGHEVHLHTLLGDDRAGRHVTAALEAAGVCVHADADAVGTEQHVNLMAADGTRLSVYRSVATPRADLDLAPVVELACTCDAVVLNITDYVRRLIRPLQDRGIPFWTDLHDWDGANPYHRDFADAAARIVLSDEGLGDPTEVCTRLAADGRLVVCTRGARGALAWAGDLRLEVPTVPANVEDTNGAGDAFTAGLLHGLHAGWPLERALRAAAVAGGTAVTSESLASPDLSAELLDSGTR